MKQRVLGRTGFEISEISLGTWQVGGRWGDPFNDDTADKILNTAIDHGVNFIDTADVYGNRIGQSEEAVGRVVRSRSEKVYVATKCGRQINPHVNEGYTPETLTKYIEDSLSRMKLDTLDLVQLHCPPTEVYYRPEIFETFERLKEQGKVQHLGVSVEKVEEALKAITYPNVDSVQIIFNIFRQRPAELFFEQALKNDIGVIVRVPLASGLLTGKFNRESTFGDGDHRHFNRDGAAFDKGETFSGVPFDIGLDAVEELKTKFPNVNLVHLALRYILSHEAVSTIIPGASRVEQVISNLSLSDEFQLDLSYMDTLGDLYKSYIKTHVHHFW